jgi:CBS domain containing-hemolysin-like protein
MLEMAAVSFNKVRLQYYISKHSKRALWLHQLLNRPALLFGTTLIMVNASLLIGSECSRRFYEAVGASPTWAPLTQAFLVLVFAEISPMFAGRRYAEDAAMLGVPILYFCAILLKPFVFAIDLLCKAVNRLCGAKFFSEVYLSREELQHVIESREEAVLSEEKQEFNTAVTNIFSLKNKVAKELMIPLKEIKLCSTQASVGEIRKLVEKDYVPFIPLFHKNPSHIVAIAYPRDLLRLSDEKKVKDHARSPWFVTESTSILQLLKQFRRNNQSIAIILEKAGTAIGVLTLDEIIDHLFAREDSWSSFGDIFPNMPQIALDLALPADMLLIDFKREYRMGLVYKQAKTLAEAMELALGHMPREGESVRIDQFELIVEESSLLGPKTITVKTLG